MKAYVLVALGLAALAADAAGAQTPAAPAWTLSLPKAPEDLARLTYEEPGAEAGRLLLSCKPKSGQMVAAFDVKTKLASRRRGDVWIDAIGRPAPWAVSVTVASLTLSTTLRGAADHNESTKGSSVAVEISTRAPVLAEWRKTGVLSVGAALEKNAPPPTPKALVSRFLRACG